LNDPVERPGRFFVSAIFGGLKPTDGCTLDL
jgi:hypothetical protein